MSAASLERALAELDIHGRVEARERLAILWCDDATGLLDDERRGAALTAARAHGFTHLALELAEPPERASLSRP